MAVTVEVRKQPAVRRAVSILLTTCQLSETFEGVYQFKRQASGRFRLIGIRVHQAENSGEPDHDTIAVVDTDFNLATGKMLFERIGDSRPLSAKVQGLACFLDTFNFDFFVCAQGVKTAEGTSAEQLMTTL
ncbi:hypothetical protein [Pseudomonas sp. NBRC 100443]|uniref:hypothetical protein n=1 Tax=Pseudomonas sp. NBRC 100443 TaxID=1113665 RepID=UPI0024A0901C|nr:hypothetical protein [Pseudomonas sp. NBRC 100443]GLU38377.1 hypothetical protein Pssp01_24700 [Pseudomonas sp. NBRC 100443]